MFAALDWLPTLVDIAGGPKGDALKKQIEAGQYPGIVKTMLDGVDQRDYLEGNSAKSARDTFFYYSGPKPSAVRYKNWKMYYTMVPTSPTGAMVGAQSYAWNMLPLGQQLWLKELQTYKDFPPLQAPESYNLDQVVAELKASRTASHV